jgi:hypothetical protein
MTDIVEDLKDSISVPAGADVNYSVPRWKIENAIKEIERLRDLVSVAGAVSTGQSAADIKEYLRTLKKDKPDGSRESTTS